MKKTIMQSTLKYFGEYGVEIGDYAVILETGGIARKPFPEDSSSYLELDQTDGKVEVTEELLEDAELINITEANHAKYLEELSQNGVDASESVNEDAEGSWLLQEEEEEYERLNPTPSNNTLVTANMSLDGKLGWEYFPGYYLLEGGVSYSPYSRPAIQEDKIEPAEGEFTVDYERYVDATRDAEKLGFIAEAEKLGIEGYID
jgi:hypothetical protein